MRDLTMNILHLMTWKVLGKVAISNKILKLTKNMTCMREKFIHLLVFFKMLGVSTTHSSSQVY